MLSASSYMEHDTNGFLAMNSGLILHREYSRQQVHDIIDPETNFTRGAGTWGIHGWIDVGRRGEHYIIFVTHGQEQAGHKFQEAVTTDGILSWQSQPKQGFQNAHVQTWINQHENKCQISLFVRNSKKKDYFYLGELDYFSHDEEKEYPVYFKFKIKDWRNSPEILALTNPIKVNISKPKQKIDIVRMIDEEGRSLTAVAALLRKNKQQVLQRYERDKREKKLNSDIVQMIDGQGKSKVAVAKLLNISKRRVWRVLNAKRNSKEKDFFHKNEAIKVIKLPEDEIRANASFNGRKDFFDPNFFHKGGPIEVIKIAEVQTFEPIIANEVNSELKELIDLHPEILGTGEGVELQYDYETTSGVKLPLVMHGPGKLKTIIDYSGNAHDSVTFKAVSNLVLMSVALAVEQERPIDCLDIERILIASRKPGPVTLKFAKLYSIKLVNLA